MVSTDGTAGFISFDVIGDFDRPKTDEILDRLVEKYQTEDIKIYPSGATVLYDIDEGISDGFSTLLPFAMLLVMVGLFFSFRTLRGVLLPMVLIVVANLCTLGIMGYLHFEFGPVTSIIPVLIVVIGGSYSIHAVHRSYEELAAEDSPELKDAIRRAMAGVAGSVTMAGVTSACGALSLLTFKVGSIQIFGISGCIGIIISLLLTLTINPAILVLLKRPKESTLQKFQGHHGGGLSSFLFNLGNFTMRRKGIVGLVTLIVLIISFVGIKMIKTGQDYIQWFGEDHPVYQAAEILNEKLGGSIAIFGMIDGGEEDAMKTPEMLNHLRKFQEFAVKEVDGVKVTSSFADVIARLHREMNAGQVESKLPDSGNLVSQYLLVYGDPSDFDSLVSDDYQQASMVIPSSIK